MYRNIFIFSRLSVVAYFEFCHLFVYNGNVNRESYNSTTPVFVLRWLESLANCWTFKGQQVMFKQSTPSSTTISKNFLFISSFSIFWSYTVLYSLIHYKLKYITYFLVEFCCLWNFRDAGVGILFTQCIGKRVISKELRVYTRFFSLVVAVSFIQQVPITQKK